MGLGIDISSTGGGGSGIRKVTDEAARLALAPVQGDYVAQLDDGSLWYFNGVDWEYRGATDPVLEVESTNAITLEKIETTNALYADDVRNHMVRARATLVLSPDAPAAGAVPINLLVKANGLNGDVLVSDIRAQMSATAPVQYNNSTGVVSMPAATNAVDGYMPATEVVRLDTVITNLANHIADAVAAHVASAIGVTPVGALTATDAQSAFAELDSDLTAAISAFNTAISDHLNDTTDAHDASAISTVVAGGVTDTDVQAALQTLATGLANHIADAVAAHAATAISVAPTGTLAATEVQAALVEILGDIEAHVASLTAHAATNITFTGTGFTGAPATVQSAIEGLTRFQTLATATANANLLTLPSKGDMLVPVVGVDANNAAFTGIAESVTIPNGTSVVLVGTSDTNTAQFPASGTLLKLNGSCTLGLNDTLFLIRINGTWVEVNRSE